MTRLTAKASITINAPIAKVWDALVNPTLIKQYFFGTEAISDWKVGSTIIFRGIWEGKTYEDKGIILAIEPNKLLRYNYWSSMSGTPDAPENYANITYSISSSNKMTVLDITQDGIATEEARKHSEDNWIVVFNGMKKLLENK
jgi:uncharacterized protein YndB with AHSA1/START domain